MRAIYAALTIAALVCACKTVGGRAAATPEDRLLHKAFEALRDRDWASYSELTITLADYDVKANNISSFAESQSFVGGVMKPQLQEAQRAQFDRALAGGEGFIDFSKAEFIGAGSVIENSRVSSITRVEVPYRLYSLRIREGEQEVDTRDRDPAFYVVSWNGEPRLLGLDFVEDEEYGDDGDAEGSDDDR